MHLDPFRGVVISPRAHKKSHHVLTSMGALFSRSVPARWCSSCGGHDMSKAPEVTSRKPDSTSKQEHNARDNKERTCLAHCNEQHFNQCKQEIQLVTCTVVFDSRTRQENNVRLETCSKNHIDAIILITRLVLARRRHVSLQLRPRRRLLSPHLPTIPKSVDSTGMLGTLSPFDKPSILNA